MGTKQGSQQDSLEGRCLVKNLLSGSETINIWNANRFYKETREYISRLGFLQGRCILDFSGINYVDTSCAATLVRLSRETRERKINLCLMGIGKQLKDLLELCKVYSLFEIIEKDSDF